MKHLNFTLLVGLVLALICSPIGALQEDDHAGHDHAPGMHGVAQAATAVAWPESIVHKFERLAVQDGGRVKPLYTLGSFALLKLNAKRRIVLHEDTDAEQKFGSSTWLLDLMLHPGVATTYESFSVSDPEVIEALGLSVLGKKARDRYSFAELRPGLVKLEELAQQYGRIDPKDRTGLQSQVVALYGNALTFTDFAGHFDFAVGEIPIPSSTALQEFFPGREGVRFSELLRRLPDIKQLFVVLGGTPGAEAQAQAVEALLSEAEKRVLRTQAVALIPPTVSVEDEPAWLSPYDLFDRAWYGEPVAPAHLLAVQQMETLVDSSQDLVAFEAALGALAGTLDDLAAPRGETEKIVSEVNYYNAKLLLYGLVTFILAFVVTACMWMAPRSRAIYLAAISLAVVATGLVIGAIVWRCILRGKPPVSTLYETILFITAVGCTVALVTEWIGRRRIALSAAAFLGMGGVFLANRYESFGKQDTMPSLMAVLDTNFWLATHVTSITVGYAAGMLAALLGSIFLIAKVLRLKRDDKGFYTDLTRMTYGVLAFGLIFSIVGTILGGIWANDSWGRFWGWDPKENGALLICLTQTAILHGRMSGFLRAYGIAMAAAFQGTVVAFSWWGVNQLGVGLHSYGFTSGIGFWLWVYYGVQWGIVALGSVAWLIERAEKRAMVEAKSGQHAGGSASLAPSDPA